MPEMFKEASPEDEFADAKFYQKFLIHLKSTKSILISDEFVFATNNYIARYFFYHRMLTLVKENNNKLIKLLQAQLKH